jgi:hypothetical protein
MSKAIDQRLLQGLTDAFRGIRILEVILDEWLEVVAQKGIDT